MQWFRGLIQGLGIFLCGAVTTSPPVVHVIGDSSMWWINTLYDVFIIMEESAVGSDQTHRMMTNEALIIR